MHYKIIALHGDLMKKSTAISYITLDENAGEWTFQLVQHKTIEIGSSTTIPGLLQLPITEFITVDNEVSIKLTAEIKKFIEEFDLWHKVDFIAFSGLQINEQIYFGNAAVVAAAIQFPVISDFHKMNLALAGNNNIYAIAHTLLHLQPQMNGEEKNVALALMAALRWREAYNVLEKDTHAQKNHIAGSVWLGVEA